MSDKSNNMEPDQPPITEFTTPNAVSPDKTSTRLNNQSSTNVSGHKHSREGFEIVDVDAESNAGKCINNSSVTMEQQSTTAADNENNNDDTSDIELSVVQVNHYRDLIATDPALRSHGMMKHNHRVSIDELMDENVKEIPRNNCIDLQLLRIVANSNMGGSAGSLRYYSKNNNNNSESKNYSRLFLCKVVNREENNLLVYMMESTNVNNNLWQRNLQYRDNGVMTVGTIFRVFHALPIKKMMANDIPMIETRYPVVVMNFPHIYHESPVDITISGNISRAFVLNHCDLDVLSVTPEQTQCGGLFCDKQRVMEIKDRKQACGCYSMLARRSNLALDYALSLTHRESNWEFTVENYSSNKFSLLFQNKLFPYSLLLANFQMSDPYFKLCGCMKTIVQKVNNNGGWTVIGWYKRGVINDQTLVGSDGSGGSGGFKQGNQNSNPQVDNAAINYHVCYLLPTNQELMNHANIRGLRLHHQKFDVEEMQTDGN